MFKKYQAEKKKCAKLYPDWVDDDFNSLHNKFIWGITADLDTNTSFATDNVICIYQNRKDKCYYFSIDIIQFGNDYDMIKRTLRSLLPRIVIIKNKSQKVSMPADTEIIQDFLLNGSYQCASLHEVCLKLYIVIQGILQTIQKNEP